MSVDKVTSRKKEMKKKKHMIKEEAMSFQKCQKREKENKKSIVKYLRLSEETQLYALVHDACLLQITIRPHFLCADAL